jgi:hypothetical protein
MYRQPVAQRRLGVTRYTQRQVEACGRGMPLRCHDATTQSPRAARLLPSFRKGTDNVDRAALAGSGALYRSIVWCALSRSPRYSRDDYGFDPARRTRPAPAIGAASPAGRDCLACRTTKDPMTHRLAMLNRAPAEGRRVETEMIIKRAGEPAAKGHPRYAGEQQGRHAP